jgi:hypothetical protein
MSGIRVSWAFIAVGPIVGLIGLEVWTVLDGYNGHCGLLDAGWDCSKGEYLWSAMTSPFVLPIVFVWIVGWLLAVGAIATVVRQFEQRRHDQP